VAVRVYQTKFSAHFLSRKPLYSGVANAFNNVTA